MSKTKLYLKTKDELIETILQINYENKILRKKLKSIKEISIISKYSLKI